jgi:formyltetrahydrofolate-dependent phosphoribosylglycinamide formyltransferase
VPKRIAVLVSGSGSNLQALLDHGHLGGRVVLVVADRPGATGLERARAAGVEAGCVDRAAYGDRAAWEAALAAAVEAAEADLVVLAGFMRILSAAFVARWPILNVHPSLLPAFPGAHAVADALEHGVRVTGATVHFVTADVDAGPIVAQQAVPVEADDTPERLHARIKQVEHELLPTAVSLFCRDRLVVDGRNVRIRS